MLLPADVVLGFVNEISHEKSGPIWPAIANHEVNYVLIFAAARLVSGPGLPDNV